MIVGAASFFYYCFVYDSLVMVLTSASKITPFQIAVGIIGILCLMELCRRCVGVPILCVAAALIIYTFAIGTPLKRVLYTLFYTTSGVMGTPIQVCAKYIVVFIIFGAFLERTGIAAFFIDLANSLVGRFAGGPAKGRGHFLGAVRHGLRLLCRQYRHHRLRHDPDDEEGRL